jgi:hypothetical protein
MDSLQPHISDREAFDFVFSDAQWTVGGHHMPQGMPKSDGLP